MFICFNYIKIINNSFYSTEIKKNTFLFNFCRITSLINNCVISQNRKPPFRSSRVKKHFYFIMSINWGSRELAIYLLQLDCVGIYVKY